MADFVKKTWACEDAITAEELNRMEDGIEEAVECCEGSGGTSMQSVTYSELKTMRDNGALTAGSQYRITDYECTTTQANSRAVANSFDIIVVADDESTLNENARACLRDGDTYYTASNHSANLEAWELKYCIDNDTSRFGWADATNGKGVIYWLKDERNNECPYDFKQIQFEVTSEDPETSKWLYTFSVRDSESEEVVSEDASVSPQDADSENACSNYSNVIRPFYGDGYAYGDKGVMYLNMNTFDNYYGSACNSNTFGDNCYSNTFGNNCYSNTFGDDCDRNTFGNNCYSNTFGDACNSNTFGDACDRNTFGNNCYSNTFGNDCGSNTFGNDCTYIDFFKDAATSNNRYYHVLDGTGGTNASHLTISGTNNNNFVTYVGKNSNGVLKTWIPADAVA